MKPFPKTWFAAIAVTLLSSSALFATDVVRRIEHPNGPPTYVTAPAEARGFAAPESRSATMGTYAGDRSFGEHEQAARAEAGLNDTDGRTTAPLHRGRGQTRYIQIER
jgi:hypothetical protein